MCKRSAHTPAPPCFSARGLNLQPNFQKGGVGGLDRTSTFRGGNFFQEGLQFSQTKIELKSEIFNDKKNYRQSNFYEGEGSRKTNTEGGECQTGGRGG